MSDDDSLLAPSLESWTRPYEDKKQRPWRIPPQYFIAFLGGPAAVSLIAWLNGKRLHLPQSDLRKIIVVGVSGILTVCVLTHLLGLTASSSAFWQQPMNRWRVINCVTAVICCFACGWLQRPGMRVYTFFHGNKGFASLDKPGLAVIFLALFVQEVIIAVIVSKVW